VQECFINAAVKSAIHEIAAVFLGCFGLLASCQSHQCLAERTEASMKY